MKPCLISIPTYNRLSFTKRCVQGILDHTNSDLYDLIITDDCSDDGTQDWLRELKIEHPEISINLFKEWVPGVVKVINFNLLRRCKKQYFVSMDNDCVHTQDDWLNKLIYLFDNNADVGIVGVKPPLVDGRGEQFPQQIFPRDARLPIEFTHGIPNSCTMINYLALEDIGFYYDVYPWTGFDYDIALRIIKCGYKAGYYCSSKTNKDDFIDIIDLGRDGEETSKHHYSSGLWEKLEAMNIESTKILNATIPKIYMGEHIHIPNTIMKDFTNYETL